MHPGKLNNLFGVIDLTVYPKSFPLDPSKRGATTVSTLGDLHGNWLKLMYFLVEQNILQVSSRDYERLVELYLSDDPIDPSVAKEFEEILGRSAVSPNSHVRLIGDVVGDRGPNDLLTLMIIDKLGKAGTQIEIPISNHDFEFLAACRGDPDHQFQRIGLGDQGRSYENLRQFRAAYPEYKERIDDLIKGYAQHIKPIFYSQLDDGTILFSTHAPVGFETYKALIEKYLPSEIFENCSQSIEKLCAALDKVNAVLTEIDSQGKLRLEEAIEDETVELLKRVPGAQLGASGLVIPLECPLLRMIWNRKLTLASDMPKEGASYDGSLYLPASYKGQKLKFEHGHIGEGEDIAPHIRNLDTNIGKRFDMDKGKYIAVR